jgi:hypothetical protein
MDEELVKVTVNNNPTDTDQTQKPSLDLQKIHEQIIERDKDANKAKELLSFLIAVEAVEAVKDLENLSTEGNIKFNLPKAVAGLLVGEQKLKLTGSTGVISNQQPKTECYTANNISQSNQDTKTVCVKVELCSTPCQGNQSFCTIDGEFYKNGQKKWRPWWKCDRWLSDTREDAQKNFFGIKDNYTGEYNLNNTNQKIRIALRDLVLAKKKDEESGQVVLTCPFTTVILLERVEGKTASHEFYNSQWKCFLKETVAIKVHQLPTIDHLIPTSLVSGSNPLASGNNLLAVSARANALKADWFPRKVNDWLSRENYVAACRKYIADEASQESSEHNYSKIYNEIFDSK